MAKIGDRSQPGVGFLFRGLPVFKRKYVLFRPYFRHTSQKLEVEETIAANLIQRLTLPGGRKNGPSNCVLWSTSSFSQAAWLHHGSKNPLGCLNHAWYDRSFTHHAKSPSQSSRFKFSPEYAFPPHTPTQYHSTNLPLSIISCLCQTLVQVTSSSRTFLAASFQEKILLPTRFSSILGVTGVGKSTVRSILSTIFIGLVVMRVHQ